MSKCLSRIAILTFILIFQPLRAAQIGITEQEGDLISVNFQDIPVRRVLQVMGEFNDFDIVVSDSVEGNITLRLDDVSWQKALDIILRVKALGKQVDGQIIMVVPQSELEQRKKRELEQFKMTEDLGELQSKVVKISYADAADITEMIAGGSDTNLLSGRGAITVDKRTNSLIVRDLPDNIQVIERLVKSLDIPVKQVQIEARLVTVSEGDLEELGVRWGISSVNDDLIIGGSLEGNHGLAQTGSSNINDMLNVNLGVDALNASGIAFSVGKIHNVLLDLELSALQAESRAEVISSPRLITTNKKPAYIEQGTEIPYLEAAASGATSVSFKKAVLSLKVTPQISPDNSLVLDLQVSQDKPGEVVKTGLGQAVAIDTQRIGTQVLINNGETVVLGGIYQHDVRNTVNKVPLLGDLPVFGHLFRRSYENLRKSELLIFVTPKVIEG